MTHCNPYSRYNPSTRALSSVYGKIEQLLMAYPGSRAGVTRDQVLERYGALFRTFGDRITFMVLGHFGDDVQTRRNSEVAFREAMEESTLDPSRHVICVHAPLAGGKNGDPFRHSEFVQDPFVVMESNFGTTILLEPFLDQHGKNSVLAEQLADAADFYIRPTRFALEGGNILVGDDFALIGRNTLEQNKRLHFIGEPEQVKEREITRGVRDLLGVRYIQWLGENAPISTKTILHSTGVEQLQPFFHLDLYLTLIGKSRGGREFVLLGEIDIDQVDGFEEAYRDDFERINVWLHRVKEDLDSSGMSRPGPQFKVERLPMGGKVVQEEAGPRFIPFSYNNAHVEYFQGIRRIYLPSYNGKELLEKRIEDHLHDHSKVEFIKNAFETYAMHSGSLHCITKVLRRTHF